jgi:hypothetical protein
MTNLIGNENPAHSVHQAPDIQNQEPGQAKIGGVAASRREVIGQRYDISPEEAATYKLLLKEQVESLPENIDLEQLADLFDTIFKNKIHDLFLDSMAGKAAESISYYLPSEASKGLKLLLRRIKLQVSGQARCFRTFKDLYDSLMMKQDIFNQYHLDSKGVAKMFKAELKSHLSKNE